MAVDTVQPDIQGPLLQVKHLSKRFGGVTAVSDVSFTVAAGEILAVVGPNGAGKSTLFQLISGVVPPDSGQVTLRGCNITGAASDVVAARGIGRTFQTSRVFPGLSIWDSVRVGNQAALIGHGTRRKMRVFTELVGALGFSGSYRRRTAELDSRAERALRLFGDRLWPRRFDPAGSLSYANRRRLEIARCLVSEPALMLLDEPMAGMNPTETAELAGLLGQIAAERPEMGIVLVEHKLQVVRQLADRVLVMDQGAVLTEGDPDAVFSHPLVVEAYLGRR